MSPALRALVVMATAASLLQGVLGCAAPQPPEPLLELRRTTTNPGFVEARQAAPDLTAEAERSLAVAERSLEGRDLARARWMATLGNLQARLAQTLSRQHRAEQRLTRASGRQREVAMDIARYRSMLEDARRERARLESLQADQNVTIEEDEGDPGGG